VPHCTSAGQRHQQNGVNSVCTGGWLQRQELSTDTGYCVEQTWQYFKPLLTIILALNS
jgi:hypothetical protein